MMSPMLAQDAPTSTGAELLAGPDTPGDWFVLHTRSRQEKSLAEDLCVQGTPHLLPLVETVRYYGRRKARVLMPLFPGYLFIKGSREQAFEADRTRRVAMILPVPDQAQFGEQVQSIQQVLAAGGDLDPHPYLAVGTRVEVTSGPFRGTVGLIDERLRGNRLILQIQALGQASSLEIDAGLLRPLNESLAAAG